MESVRKPCIFRTNQCRSAIRSTEETHRLCSTLSQPRNGARPAPCTANTVEGRRQAFRLSQGREPKMSSRVGRGRSPSFVVGGASYRDEPPTRPLTLLNAHLARMIEATMRRKNCRSSSFLNYPNV